jgi:ABC-2 type transport system permease protein
MFWQLMKIRLWSARNTVQDTARRHPLRAFLLSALGGVMFVGMVAGFLLFFTFAERLGVLEETVYQVFYFLFLFLLAGAVPFVASTLLHSSDYDLLFAAPVPPRTVIAAKLLDATVTNSLQFTVLGLPAIVACAAIVGIPLWGWLLLPLLIVLFVLLPALLTAFGLLLALAAFGIRRLRAAIGLLNLVMAFVVCLTIVLEAKYLPRQSLPVHPSQLTLPPQLAMHRSPAAHTAPSQWFASALLALHNADFGTLALTLALAVLVVAALYAGCMVLGGRLLTASTTEENEGERFHSEPKDEARRWRSLFSAPVAALIVKDIKYLWRDSVLLSQVTMPLILFLVPFLLALQDSAQELRQELHGATIVMIGVILFMQTSILSLSSIGLESRSFWIVRNAPNTGRLLLRAKFTLSTFLSAGTGALLTLFSGFALRASLPMILFQMVGVALCAAALCGLGVGISAAFPRFIYENPAHRVSAWALILGFFASVGYLTMTGVFYALAYLISLQPGAAGDTSLAFGIAALLHFVLTVCSIVFPLEIGARRIENYQWEH